MKYFFDTEFHDTGKVLDLISIGIVPKYGDETYYAVSSEFDLDAVKANPWLVENVLNKLGDPRFWKPRAVIAQEILVFLLPYASSAPDIWAYNAASDWVCFYRLFGPLANLPQGLPNSVRDVKQVRDMLRIPKERLPPHAGAHNALDDAIWLREVDLFLDKEAKIALGESNAKLLGFD